MIPIGKTTDLLSAKPIVHQLQVNAKEVNDKVMKMITKAGMQVGTDLTPMAIELMAEDLIDAFKYDSLEDIAEALKKGRQGRYGKVYGKMNGIVLAEWMGKHLEEKAIARETCHKQNSSNSTQEREFNKEFKRRMSEIEQKEDEERIKQIISEADRIINSVTEKREKNRS